MIADTWGGTWGRAWGNTWGRTVAFQVPQIYGADPGVRRRKRAKTIIEVAEEEGIKLPFPTLRKLERVAAQGEQRVREVFIGSSPLLLGKILAVVRAWQRHRRNQQTLLLLM